MLISLNARVNTYHHVYAAYARYAPAMNTMTTKEDAPSQGIKAVLGLRGLIIGPVVMALAVAVLRLYAREAEAKRPRP